jgi:hypothetical protein
MILIFYVKVFFIEKIHFQQINMFSNFSLRKLENGKKNYIKKKEKLFLLLKKP